MIDRIIIQVLPILVIGYELSQLIFHEMSDDNHLRYLNHIVNSITMGYTSLVLPMIVVGRLFDNLLDEFVYAYFGIGMLLVFYRTIRILPNLFDINIDLTRYNGPEKLLIVAITAILGFHLFVAIILPERGWDALHYYFPNALFFFLSDSIPARINPLSFYPVFKAPVVSLIITYSFYVTNGMYAQLHPFIFILGSTILVYLTSLQLGLDRKLSLLSTLFFAYSPLIFFLNIEFAFYQEPSLLFFIGSTMYYILRMEGDSGNVIFSSLALSMAILSKLTGYLLPFIIIMAFNIKNIDYRIKQVIVLGATAFLARKALFDTYWGIAILVGILGIILIILLRYQEVNKQISISQFVGMISLPLIVGLGWLLFILQLQGAGPYIQDTFIRSTKNTISMSFPAVKSPLGVNPQNGMRASFWASILYPLTGEFMILPWMWFKLIGFKKYKNHNFLIVWMTSYFLVYFAYFSEVTARYYIPILIPISILTAIGAVTISQRLGLNDWQQTLFLIISIFFGIFFYLPVMPIRIFQYGIYPMFYYYHKYQLVLLLYVILFAIVFRLLAYRIRQLNLNTVKTLSFAMVVLLVITPFAYPVGTYIHDKAGGPDYVPQIVFFQRPEYREVIDVMENEELQPGTVTLSMHTPGLEYFIQRPVLDLAIVFIQENLKPRLKKQNITEAYDFMQRGRIYYVIKLKPDNYLYDVYKEQVEFFSIFQVVVDDDVNFDLIFQNSEFKIFHRINSGDYINTTSN